MKKNKQNTIKIIFYYKKDYKDWMKHKIVKIVNFGYKIDEFSSIFNRFKINSINLVKDFK